MPAPAVLLGFVAATVTLVLVPGPNLIYILTRSLTQGRRAGFLSALGVEAGTLVHVIAAVAGVSALVAASPTAFTAVRLAGAAYLVYLAVRTHRQPAGLDLTTGVRSRPVRLFLDGALINVLNPKVMLFFLTFLPQFVPAGADPATTRTHLLVLGAVGFAVALLLDLAYVQLSAPLHRLLTRRPRFLRWQRDLAVIVYLGLAAFTVLTAQL
ncbi:MULTISPECIES: LysE family translocator [unclassified Crossiella]|uniref:LysE family translocator n=1 Tax=unclassified Crossiella TaxID=2620835 RepID=UPI001FFF979C|nr:MULTISPECIES: LysE family translocator [unclassified Crossiella]MCK2240282.1 LysE family translocator [Crossiella sp. S99.2]MCK2253266.1 LysE family translocator [Crossiella sp. S99.1]